MTEMVGDDEEDTTLLQELASEASAYLSAFSWCGSVEERYFGLGAGGMVGVFLFRILPSRPGIDEWLWVIVGDLPPAYLVVDGSRTPIKALRTYIAKMTDWVELASKGRTSHDVIPVNVPATPEWAERLRGRLQMLETVVIPNLRVPDIWKTN